MSGLEERQARDTAALARGVVDGYWVGGEAVALRRCGTCDGGDPRCLDCRGSGYVRRAEVADPYEGGHADLDGADDEPLGEPT